MLVAQRTLAHIRELDGALRARVHEPVAAEGVELGGSDDLSQLLHVGGFDVDNVETLVLYVQVPQVDAQIVAADECLAIAVDRDAVDVVRVGVGVCSTGYGSNDGVVVGEARQLEVGGVFELRSREWSSSTSTARQVAGSGIVGQIVLCHNLERLLEDLP